METELHLRRCPFLCMVCVLDCVHVAMCIGMCTCVEGRCQCPLSTSTTPYLIMHPLDWAASELQGFSGLCFSSVRITDACQAIPGSWGATFMCLSFYDKPFTNWYIASACFLLFTGLRRLSWCSPRWPQVYNHAPASGALRLQTLYHQDHLEMLQKER